MQTDHCPLVYIFCNDNGKLKLTRWAFKIQALDLKVKYIAGRANILADYLSRVPIQEVVGLYDSCAFDLTSEIPPTYLTLTALEEWHADFDRQLEVR